MNLRSFINSWYKLVNNYILITNFYISYLISFNYWYEITSYL